MKRKYKGKYFYYEILHGGIVELVFDEEGKEKNQISMPMLLELEKVIDEFSKVKGIKAILFESNKKNIFISGNEIKEICDIKFETEAIDFSKKGQEVFSKIQHLPFQSIAIIDGACIDGGLELALACSFRVVSDNPESKLGFTFSNIGLFPFYGGCVRLSKLVGIKQALKITLNNTIMDGQKAWQIGLADRYFPAGFLKEKTLEFLNDVLDIKIRKKMMFQRKQKKFLRWLKENNSISRRLIVFKSKKEIKKNFKFYPALLTIVGIMKKVTGRKGEKGFALERKAFGKLAVSESSKRLMGIYFIKKEINGNYIPDKKTQRILEKRKVKDVWVAGIGEGGGEIVWVFSNADINVRIKDFSWDILWMGYQSVYRIYSQEYGKNCLEDRKCKLKLHKISATTDYSGCKQADFIIDNVEENKERKIKLLRELEDKVRREAIIAMNTNIFSVDELAHHLKHPDRFLGLHFFNPINQVPLIEVVRGKKTSDFAVSFAINISRRIGKIPIVIKDCHGFLVNRILSAGLNEAFLMLQEGYDFWKIDSIIDSFGFPYSPFYTVDKIGIKKFNRMLKVLLIAYPDRMEQVKIIDKIDESSVFEDFEKVFYLPHGRKRKPNSKLVSFLKEKGFTGREPIKSEEVLNRFIIRMINEAAFCIEEDIINKPEYLDMAMLLGNSFPYFRGGLLRYADDFGLEKIIDQLQEYEMRFGKRFSPSGLLHQLRVKESGFYCR